MINFIIIKLYCHDGIIDIIIDVTSLVSGTPRGQIAVLSAWGGHLQFMGSCVEGEDCGV